MERDKLVEVDFGSVCGTVCGGQPASDYTLPTPLKLTSPPGMTINKYPTFAEGTERPIKNLL